MKGCVRGYGNYEELTSSGVDPTELFDNMEDCKKSPDLEQSDILFDDEDDQQDIQSPNYLYPLATRVVRRRPRSTYFEGNRDSIFDLKLDFDQLSEQTSICTAPSLHSLTSMHNLHSIRENKEVIKTIHTNVILYSLQYLEHA